MWGSGHALIWITCLLFSLYRSSLPHDIKDVSLLLLPHSLSTCQSFLFSVKVTHTCSLFLSHPKSVLELCRIPYPMTPRFMEDLQAPNQHFKKLRPHCLGSGSFYTEPDGCLGHVWCMPLCIADTPGDWLASFLLAVQSRQSCWNCKQTPKSQQLSITKQLDKAVVTTCERPWAPDPSSVT